MKLLKFFLINILFVIFTINNVYSYTAPVSVDSRIKTFVYSESEVYHIVLHYGYQASIELAKGEEVDTISIGNSYALQVTPIGNRIFLKTMESNTITNMTLITNKRNYQFDVISKEASEVPDSDLVYVVRFFYPDNLMPISEYEKIAVAKNYAYKNMENNFAAPMKPQMVSAKKHYNYDYKFVGNEKMAPSVFFDDGQKTYMRFNDMSNFVKIFYITGDSKTNISPFENGDYITMEQVSSKWEILLKDGSTLTIMASR